MTFNIRHHFFRGVLGQPARAVKNKGSFGIQRLRDDGLMILRGNRVKYHNTWIISKGTTGGFGKALSADHINDVLRD